MPVPRASPWSGSSAVRRPSSGEPGSCSSAARWRPRARRSAEAGVGWTPVSGENLQIVRRGFEAFNESGVEGILPMIHPDFEATTPPSLASEPDTYRGVDGIRRWFDSFDEVMEEIRWDARAFHEAGDRVVVEFTLRARGKTTGLDFGQDAVMVWELRDRKATRLELYPTLDEAMAAAGPESGAAP